MKRGPRFELIGGHPILDLVNTVSWRGDPARRIDRVPDLDALLTWSVRAGVLTTAESEQLVRASSREAAAGESVLRGIQRLRENVHDALTSPRPGTSAAIRRLWPELAAALRHARPEELPLRAAIELGEPRDLTRRLALLAFEFLASQDVRRIGVCADTACGWVFLDRSPNRTRRWCSSSDCGNRARVRRHHTRHARP